MRHKLIVLCTAFLFLLFASPAWADVNLNVNGALMSPLLPADKQRYNYGTSECNRKDYRG